MDNFREDPYAVLGIRRHARPGDIREHDRDWLPEIRQRYRDLLQEIPPDEASDPAIEKDIEERNKRVHKHLSESTGDELPQDEPRERQQDPMRPLIFIGHCFGGLVIQRALITARLCPESETEEAILNSTVGAVFLGTPHRGTGAFGSQSALLAAIAAQSDLYVSMESDVLDAMEAERGELLDVSEDFLKLSVRADLRITCFFEQMESNLGKMIERDDIKQFVVDETYARLGANRAIGLPTDHFKLNKFAAPEDGNYLDVAGEVSRLYTEALELAIERRSRRTDSVGALEQYQRLVAKQELKLEEAAKEAALKEEDFERRFQEILEQNVLLPKDDVMTGRQQAERLKRNMRRYGLDKRTVHRVLQDNPIPSMEDFSHDCMQERDEWYQNSLKEALSEAGLDEGKVDAIIHDTGETMVIEGMRTSVTRMSERWLDERTLQEYDIPFMRDPEQSSILVIKQWAPLHEKEILWDHTQDLRARWEPEDTTSWYVPGSPEELWRNRSAESILSPPSSQVIAQRRNSSRTLHEQIRSRQSSIDSVARIPVLDQDEDDMDVNALEEEETNTMRQEGGGKALIARKDRKTREKKDIK
ncbi:hypothetical protein INS49_007039 [Diaporthe citri]|uniref:uncharacterized protein n=1 Tax=Diaporthe citri TaxID=83186 RepID=UPI001C7F30F8|nr:uncharacterized protein INS49_007039 [Diaporthe citri]KAG6365428.1 hypothetical protein INS49_007039 [Diaporthe citri]